MLNLLKMCGAQFRAALGWDQGSAGFEVKRHRLQKKVGRPAPPGFEVFAGAGKWLSSTEVSSETAVARGRRTDGHHGD
jgi:hypothetical protein